MTQTAKPQIYRDLIDCLVDDCHKGQGQIAARRVRAGVWNANATAKTVPDQHKINIILGRMPVADREILAELLVKEFEGGIFMTLVALEQFKIAPFESGYEGSSHKDFIGRLGHWEWPDA